MKQNNIEEILKINFIKRHFSEKALIRLNKTNCTSLSVKKFHELSDSFPNYSSRHFYFYSNIFPDIIINLNELFLTNMLSSISINAKNTIIFTADFYLLRKEVKRIGNI